MSAVIAAATAITIANTLALEGYNVVLNYNNSEKEAFEIKENLKKYNKNIELCKDEWNSNETSWDFKKHPLLIEIPNFE